jgi:phospholipase C
LQFLEVLTGVRNPNISAWRRQTVGNFTGALGCTPSRAPQLPSTGPGLALAEQEVRQYQLPPFPGADQSFPVPQPGPRLAPVAC